MRGEHGFGIGQAEAHDALRAVRQVGIDDRARFKTALRLVCCAAPAQLGPFDAAFDAFFAAGAAPAGVPQPDYRPRHTRPGREERKPGREQPAPRERPGDEGDGNAGVPAERRPVTDAPDDATVWQMLRARYSAVGAAAAAAPPAVCGPDRAAMLRAAGLLVASVRACRSRRWRAMDGGSRFDLRRTVRASLQTGGDLVALRLLGHPLRNPRFVVLVDGSRSSSDRTGSVVRFAAALCERTSRANVFFFSTRLREVTRALRLASRTGAALGELGESWGGGTKIGESLAAFVAGYGARLLTPETLVIVFSDGLDVGDLPQLQCAMRELQRRSAAVVWLNPHAAAPGYAPTARGMRAALPFVTLLTAAEDAAGFERLARRVAATAAVRGRRH